MLGALQAWRGRLDMNPDGIQYLDNAAAYASRDFPRALNTQWSPLYPWLLAAASSLTHATREQQFPLAHLVNFFVYALSVIGFLFFVRALRRSKPAANSPSFLLLSYSAFLYCSLEYTNLRYVTPDLLVNLFTFLTAALLMEIAGADASTKHFPALGAALGFGYLAKAPFLPIGLVCLVIAAKFGRKRVVLACVVFAAIAAPYIAFLSHAQSRFTFGDSAKLNLAWQVNGLPNKNWQGGPAANGRPIHATRQISERPAIFEFGAPIAATYPPWYDPAYWNQGVQIAWRPQDFARAIATQVLLYGYLLHHRQLPLLFALVALWMLRPRNKGLAAWKPLWPILALGATPFLLYAPVHAEDRYLAPFFVLLWTALFCGLLRNGRASLAIAAAAALLMLMESAIATFTAPIHQPPAQLHYDIAHDLAAFGLKPAEPVAMVTSDLPDYWAYLAGARITLEITFSDNLRQRESEWAAARRALASQNAKFLISPSLDGVTDQPGWVGLGTTQVFAYPTRASAAY